MNEIDKPRYLYEGESLEIQNWNEKSEIRFNELVKAVKVTSGASQASALKAINRMHTMRNWLIGYYIVEFEQKGKERAQYGDKLLKRLEEAVNEKGLTVTLFQWARRFYIIYPQMEKLIYTRNQEDSQKYASVMPKLQVAENLEITKSASVMHQFVSSPEAIVSSLSFTHLREIMSIDDPLVRYFYEQECMRCTWSVRELRRQITSASSTHTSPTGKKTKCNPETIRQSVSCSAPRKERKWSNTPRLEWITLQDFVLLAEQFGVRLYKALVSHLDRESSISGMDPVHSPTHSIYGVERQASSSGKLKPSFENVKLFNQ